MQSSKILVGKTRNQGKVSYFNLYLAKKIGTPLYDILNGDHNFPINHFIGEVLFANYPYDRVANAPSILYEAAGLDTTSYPNSIEKIMDGILKVQEYIPEYVNECKDHF